MAEPVCPLGEQGEKWLVDKHGTVRPSDADKSFFITESGKIVEVPAWHYLTAGSLLFNFGLPYNYKTEEGRDDAMAILEAMTKEVCAVRGYVIRRHAQGDGWDMVQAQILAPVTEEQIAAIKRVRAGLQAEPGKIYYDVQRRNHGGVMLFQRSGSSSDEFDDAVKEVWGEPVSVYARRDARRARTAGSKTFVDAAKEVMGRG